MEDFHSSRLMNQFSPSKQHFLVNMGYKSLRVNIGNRLKYLIFEVLLHFGDIAHSFFGKPLELGNINISPIHCQCGILWEMDFLEQIVVMLCGRCEPHYHRHAHMILHDGMHLQATFLLTSFRMLANTFEYVVKESDFGGVHHIEQLLPVLWFVCLAIIALVWASVR